MLIKLYHELNCMNYFQLSCDLFYLNDFLQLMQIGPILPKIDLK
jgi:hypothetical protein